MSPGTLCPWLGTCQVFGGYLLADTGAGLGVWPRVRACLPSRQQPAQQAGCNLIGKQAATCSASRLQPGREAGSRLQPAGRAGSRLQHTACYPLGKQVAACYPLGKQVAACYLLGEQVTGFSLLGEQVSGCYLLGEQVTGCYLLTEQIAAFQLLAKQVTGCYLPGKQVAAGNLLGQQFTGCNLLAKQFAGCNLLGKQVAASNCFTAMQPVGERPAIMQTGVRRNSSDRSVQQVLTCQTDPPNESDSSNLPVQRVTLVGQTCPTSEHVGQLFQPDDSLDMSAQLLRAGWTSTSDIWLARAVRLAGPTTRRTAPLDLEMSWAVRQVSDTGHQQVGSTTCRTTSSDNWSDGPV
ncbi:hypothetical protein PCANC_01364 [Puccinia coronata f. sp. avenae]|uniref:Uncharacterized protein n=1 Tax=Puccinia coronata f. sp. avenae TaxID=200324 RepID=A0A2N5W660_9BASI|nr:hypothetical protein PCANC_01364 [Puccinia coronata f. sp. avenae]